VRQKLSMLKLLIKFFIEKLLQDHIVHNIKQNLLLLVLSLLLYLL